MLLSSVISMLGLGSCKTLTPNPVPVVYGPPPIVYVEDTIIVERQEMKVVYGPPVVMTLTPDWHNAIPDTEGIYDVAEVMPQFPGGEMAMNRWIAENIRIPEQAFSEGAGGSVMVSFIVTVTGKLDGVTVLRPIHPLLDAEAIRLVKTMPKWTPGEQKGKTVAVRYFIPVDFR